MSAMPSNDVLLERLSRFGEQLERHREEAREANVETNRKLDEVLVLKRRVDDLEEAQTEFHRTVNGEKDEPGMKGRLDRAEQRIAMGVWIAAAVALGLLTLIFDWLKRFGAPH